MNTLNREQCNAAIREWSENCKDYDTIKNLIPSNYVFNFGADQIDWMRKFIKNSEFCAEIGIYQNQLVAVLYPLDPSGQKIIVDDYPYSFLNELREDLNLVQTEEYRIVKNAVLSKDLRKIDDNSNMYYPVANMPMLEQDRAVAAIESWRNDSINWFYRECDEYEGQRIFRKFFVPAQDISNPKPGLTHVVCAFGLKYSDIYQRMLPTLIFISFYQDLQNTGSIQTISNTYDWSQACPPSCNIL